MLPLDEPSLLTSATGQLLQLGLAGIVILGEAYAIVMLFRALQKAQDTRVVDAQAVTSVHGKLVEASTSALVNQAASNGNVAEALDRLTDALNRNGGK
jgi:hypothetical protein